MLGARERTEIRDTEIVEERTSLPMRFPVAWTQAEKQLAAMRSQLKKLDEDKSALFREVSSLEAQLAQAHADREEARNWASTYRDMLLKVA